MATFAPALQREHYVYHGDFFVDVGNANRHKRASKEELTALLRPALSNKNVPVKDEVGHYYEAQLVHYGLPVSKSKPTAKVRLLDALNQGKLKVPEAMQKVEGEMKAQWENENRKAKAAYLSAQKSSGGSANAPASSGPKKRKQDGEETEPKKTKKQSIAGVSTSAGAPKSRPSEHPQVGPMSHRLLCTMFTDR